MKQMPASRTDFSSSGKSASILIPRVPSTSAAPDLEDAARLPCFAMGTPHPATTIAMQVEILYVPDRSPPVPTTSIAPSGALIVVALARMVVAAPVISSTVSPRVWRANSSPPICEAVASPDIMISKACAASAVFSVPPLPTLARSPLKISAFSAIARLSGPSNPKSSSTNHARVPRRYSPDETVRRRAEPLYGRYPSRCRPQSPP